MPLDRLKSYLNRHVIYKKGLQDSYLYCLAFCVCIRISKLKIQIIWHQRLSLISIVLRDNANSDVYMLNNVMIEF